MFQPSLDNPRATLNEELERVIQRLYNHFYESIFDERAFDIYILPRNETSTQSANPGMVERLQELIAGDAIDSMLVLGDPGLGKTLLSYHLATLYWEKLKVQKINLTESCAVQLEENPTEISNITLREISKVALYLPVWLYLPSIPENERATNLLPSCWKQNGLSKLEVALLQTACQQGCISLLIIIDGLDEIKIPTENFYLSNGWFQDAWPQVKVITFSRPEGFSTLAEPIDYQQLFYTRAPKALVVADSFKELYLQPFSEDDIDTYLAAFTDKHAPQRTGGVEGPNWQDWHTYKQTLQRISPLTELAKNPFILNILVQALPRIVQEVEAQQGYVYTRERVYRMFVDDWLERQARRIWWDNPAQQKVLLEAGLRRGGEQAESKQPPTELIECLWTYSENLARFALHEGQGKLKILLSEAQTRRYELVHRPDREAYFLEGRLLEDEELRETILEIIRSGCLLKCQGQVYRFLHRTIVEFFAARALFNGAHIAAEYYLKQLDRQLIEENFQLNENSLLKEPQIIHMLANLVNEEPPFKKLLYSIIELSKEESMVETAAANAITILNVAGEVFNDRNFIGIRVRGANFTGAICDRTNFSGADLSGACFDHAWLRGTKFNGANLENAKFGELPTIKHDKVFTVMEIDAARKVLFTGDLAGYITQWELMTGRKLSSWKAPSWGIGTKLKALAGNMPITALTLSPDGKQLAYVLVGFKNMNDISEVRISTLDGSKQKYLSLIETPSTSNAIYFLSESKLIFVSVSCSQEDTPVQHLSLWDIGNGECVKHFCDAKYPSYALSFDKKYLAYKGENKIVVYSFESEKDIFIEHNRDYCYIHSFSPKNTWLVLNKGENLIFYKIGSWVPVKTFKSMNEQINIYPKLAFTADEKIMVWEGKSRIGVWRIESGECLYEISCITLSSLSANNFPSISPIIIPLSAGTEFSRIYCLRDNFICIFELNTVAKSFQRSSHCVSLNDIVHKGFLRRVIWGREECWEIGKLNITYKAVEQGNYGLLNNYYLANLAILKNSHSDCSFDFTHENTAVNGSKPSILLSPNQRYLVFALMEYDACEAVQAGPEWQMIVWGIGVLRDSRIRLFDLQQKQHRFTFKHHNQITSMLFSSDSQWLITAGYTTRIWEMATGMCLHQYKIESWTDAVALSQDKKWLAIADGARNLSLWDTGIHKQIFRLVGLSRRIHKLAFSRDGKFLICNLENKYIVYHVRFNGSQLPFLQLVERFTHDNIFCQNAKINDCILPDATATELFVQLGAQGSPISVMDKHKNKILLENALRYEKPIINVSEREYRSLIYSYLPLTYNNWVVSLLRDTQSAYPNHTFLIIEGVNAWGRFQLYRYEIATKVDNKPIEEGFAAVIPQAFSGLSRENYQDTFLYTLLKADPEAGRGLESIVGHAWSLSRVKCLALHQAVLAEKRSGFIPYSTLGDNSLFSWGKHNCYTWCRKHLLTLRDPHITKNLPSRVTDYVGVHPKFHLTMPAQPVANRYRTHCPVM